MGTLHYVEVRRSVGPASGIVSGSRKYHQNRYPLEDQAFIDERQKSKFDAIDALANVVRLHTYKCDSVSAARPWISSRGYTLVCNHFSYEYEIADKGGHWIVTVK